MSARGGAGNQFSVSRLFSEYDEDVLGKKDDDHKPTAANSFRARWSLRYRSRKRWILASGAIFIIWVFLRYLPNDFFEPNQTGEMRLREFHSGGVAGVGPGGRPYPPPRGGGGGGSGPVGYGYHNEEGMEKGPPPRPKGRGGQHYYDGEVLFHDLPTSLHRSERTMGFRKVNQNVLFAASNLKSVATLIPLACEMTKWENSFVHVALFGRSDIKFDEVLKINGVDKKECRVFWHDARPNWAGYSSDFRAEAGVASALEFIQQLMHPQVIITDDSTLEDGWFTRQIRIKAGKFEWPIIEMPAEASEKLHWIARLDAQSLKNFHRTSVDIVVQAPPRGEAGSLMRLLRSLAEADYDGLTPPRITIELPAEIDPMTKWFVGNYKWPPRSSPLQPMMTNQLMLRHRIPGQTLSPEESSIRFMESFYPAEEQNSHVLVLNPNVELSKLWYHWLNFYILQYKYSRPGAAFSESIIGISLDIPMMYLNGTTRFEPPPPESLDASLKALANAKDATVKPPFLWQAPGADAVLYYGDKWAEIQDFLRHRIRTIHESKKTPEKIIGEHMPAWTEYFLELMRARGWSLIYPSTSDKSVKGMVTVHKELYKPPEEFAISFLQAKTKGDRKQEDEKEEMEKDVPMGKTEPLRGLAEHWEAKQEERPLKESFQPLHSVLPYLGGEPLITALPQLLWDGRKVEQLELSPLSGTYADVFRHSIGGCPEKKDMRRKVVMGLAGDLFCWGDEDGGAWEKVVKAKGFLDDDDEPGVDAVEDA